MTKAVRKGSFVYLWRFVIQGYELNFMNGDGKATHDYKLEIETESVRDDYEYNSYQKALV